MSLISIQRKLFLAISAATLFYCLCTVIFAQTVIRGMLIEKLQEKGVVIAKMVASNAVSPVITESYFEITMMFRDLQAGDADVVYAYVSDENGHEIAHTFAGGVPPELWQANPVDPLRPASVKELETDKGAVLDIGVPLLHGRIGTLHLGLSLTSIRSQVNRIVMLIALFSVGMLIVGALAAIGFSRIITRPLLNLAGAAESFGRGDDRRSVSIESRDEVGNLARVFNEMMESRRRAGEEQAQLIEKLQQTLGEVKTLRGFLPICSSCKKIRSDQGYWQQIESYIRDHSEAEFSHGLCPECAKRLYPEVWRSISGKFQA